MYKFVTCKKDIYIVRYYRRELGMKTFDWDDSYSVRVKKFDDEHKHLFEIVKDLYQAMEHKDDRLALAMIINDLIRYSKEHFSNEEITLLNTQYPNYEKHRKQHKLFIEKIEQLAADYNSGNHLLHFDMLLFLKNWVLQHILVADKHYGDHLNSNGIF